MLSFNSISSYKKGDLFKILYKSYENLLSDKIKNKEKYIENWKRFDKDSLGAIEYFLPARRMYQSLGFKKVGKYYNKTRGFDIIVYEKDLTQ